MLYDTLQSFFILNKQKAQIIYHLNIFNVNPQTVKYNKFLTPLLSPFTFYANRHDSTSQNLKFLYIISASP